ncbi:type I restriction system adenine methylase HsdM [Tepidicella xavieri]|uniref:site-specific DNA-methyltransferase (adenine-specific) n=2 Tax=Tepidicella xavieri TaxID=360241 RepID=A0A4R6UGN6_9BURK|nr:type I restriction system adenine methylase HsdM [Tepidicella xavieri]
MTQPQRVETLSHAQRERLAYIDFRLYFFGEIGRPDLIERFGVAPAGATRDLALYRQIAPQNILFDGSHKVYRIGQTFSPLFEHAPQRVLSALAHGFGDGVNGPAKPLQPLLPCESPAALSIPRMEVLAPICRAIHARRPLAIRYHSMTSGETERVIVPFALVDTGLRWHVRAFDRKRGEFRDFVLTRIEAPALLDEAPQAHERPDHDIQWTRIVELEFVPHPRLERPAIIGGTTGCRAAHCEYGCARRWRATCCCGGAWTARPTIASPTNSTACGWPIRWRSMASRTPSSRRGIRPRQPRHYAKGKHTMAQNDAAKNGNGGHLGFEAELFKAADKLRGNMEPSDYKHVALGLIFLKYISDTFEAKHQALLAEDPQAAEDKDEYLADYVFWVPPAARWSHLQANAKRPEIGTLIDDAMRAIEKDNESLKGVLPKDYARPALNKVMLGELIDLISGIALGEEGNRSKDILGRAYEYFLGQFAGAEGKRGGEFYTPRSVVRVLVEMLEPYSGRVYDPCCGSGGMFVQSEKFVEEHGGRIGDIAIYGQESNYTTWRLAKMNLAVRGIDADIRWNNEGSFHKDELRDLKADYILANPPFNISDWGGERLREDVRWKFGVPPVGNANYAWLQHIYHHLAPNGTAGVVLANGSMSSQQSGEGEIRKAMLEADVVDCMVALPGQLFYSTQIPACLWFLARNKNPGKGWRDRRGQVLFIDARKLGVLVDRTRRELTDEEIQKIADTYHAWRGEPGAGEYTDVAGFCKSATLEEIRKHGYVLTPGRYVGAAEQEDDGEPFEEKMARLAAQWREQRAEAARLNAAIEANLKELGYGG